MDYEVIITYDFSFPYHEVYRYSYDLHFRGGKDYDHIYFETGRDANREIPVNDSYNYSEIWNRVFPKPIGDAEISGKLELFKSIYTINDKTFSTMDQGLNPSLSYYNEYDWYKFELNRKNDVQIDVREFGGTFDYPVSIQLFNEDFQLFVTSTLGYYYYTPTQPYECQRINATLDPGEKNKVFYIRVSTDVESGQISYFEPYNLIFNIVRELYQKQSYIPDYTFVSTETIYSPYYSPSTTYESGEYLYVYSDSISEYKHDYVKYEYYDKITLVIKRKDIFLGCDSCDADDTIATYNFYADEAPSSKNDLPGLHAYINDSYFSGFTFPSSLGFEFNGKYIFYNESGLKNGQYYVATYSKTDDNFRRYLGTFSTNWLSYIPTDG